MKCPDCGENTFLLREKRAVTCSNCNYKEDLIAYLKPFTSNTGFDLQLYPSDIFEIVSVKLEGFGSVASLHIAPQQNNRTRIIVSMLVPSTADKMLRLLKIAFGDSIEIFCEYCVSTKRIEKCPLCGGMDFKGTKKLDLGADSYRPSDFTFECKSCQRFHIHVYFYLLNLIYDAGFIPRFEGKEVTGNFRSFTVSNGLPGSSDFASLEERGSYPLVLTCLRPLSNDVERFERFKAIVESVAVGKVVVLKKQ